MKPIKLHLPIFLLLVLSTVDSTNAQTQVGITVGANFSNAYIEDDIINTNETQYTVGFRFGLSVDIPLHGVFYLQPAIAYSQKGFKQEENLFSGTDNEFEAFVAYIDAPINLLYKSRWGPGDLVLGAGPYAAYGLSGQWKTEREIDVGLNMKSDHGEVIFGNDASDREIGQYVYGKPLDYGGNVLVGYDLWGAVSIYLMGQFGVNLQPKWYGQQLKSLFKNRNYNVSLGYKF